MASDAFGRFSAVILVVGLAVSSLVNIHQSPQTVIFAEWGVGLALVLALLGFLISAKRFCDVRVGAVFGLAMLLFVLSLFRLPFSSVVGYAAYVGLFLLSLLLGGFVSSGQEAMQKAEWIAAGLLVCALLQSVAGVAQLAGWPSAGLVLQKMYLQAFGNIGQANHYANLVFLGLGSLCFLHARKFVNVWWTAGLAAWLALAAAASASRSVWLYTFVFAFLGGGAHWRGGDEARRAGRALLLAAACSVVAQILVAYGHILDVFGVTSSLERAGDAGSNGQRLYNWHAAWLAIKEHPWLGQGPGSFYKASIDAMFLTPPASFPKFAEHAHNLPLNLAVEFGVPIAVL